MLTFLTLSSNEYFDRFLVLYDSIKKYHPESPIILYAWEPIVKAIPEGVTVKHTPKLLSDVRAKCFLDAFSEGHTRCVWVGADCVLYNRLDTYNQLLNEHSILVTPHLYEPLPDDGKDPSNKQIHRVGHLNSDILFVKNDANGIKAMNWYQEQLQKYNYDDIANGIFLDQSWLNFLPFCFDGVRILRNYPINVAYWNVVQVDLQKGKEVEYWTKFGPLDIFHFSGYTMGSPENMSKYQNRYTVKNDVLDIFKEYEERLKNVP